MITITKQNDGVLFTFQDSDKYLYGNGTIEVPFNTLSIIADESDMITLKKAASNDVFLSARYDTDLGYRSKDDAIDDLKGMLFAETGGGGSGSGVTPSEVQEMIDESISGKADTSDVTAVANDVSTLSGQVATKVAITDFNAYSAATDSRLAEDEEVTAAALNDLDAALNDLNDTKQDNLEYYSEGFREVHITVEDTDNNVTGETSLYADGFDMAVTQDVDETTQSIGYINGGNVGVSIGYDLLTGSDETDAHSYFNVDDNGISADVYADEETTTFEITSTGVTINGENVLTDGIITTAITSGSTDSEIPTAKAVYDAIPTGGTSVTVDPTLDSGSTNPVANSAITTAMNAKADKTGCLGIAQISYQSGYKSNLTTYNAVGSGGSTKGYFGGINGSPIAVQYSNQAKDFQLVEKSAITSAMTSSSTDAQVPSAKAVYDTLGGLKFVKLTQSEYDQLATKDPDTLYIISNVVS